MKRLARDVFETIVILWAVRARRKPRRLTGHEVTELGKRDAA